MTIQLLLTSIVLMSSLGMHARFAPAPLPQETSDENQIRQILNDYVVGWREADGERLAEVFAEEGRVMWISKRSEKEILQSMTFAKFSSARTSHSRIMDLTGMFSISILWMGSWR